MKATLERHRLNSALRRISTGAGSTAPLVITASAGAVELVAVGRKEMFITEVEAAVDEDGAAEVMVKQILSVVKSLSGGAMTMESAEGGGIALTGGGAGVVLAQQDELCGAEWPEPQGRGTPIEGDLLRSSLGGVIPAAATDNHPIFGSVRFDEEDGVMRVVASDTFRLAVRDLSGTAAPGVFSVNVRVLKRMLRAFGKASAYRVWSEDGYLWFEVERMGKMGIGQDSSDYPRYRGWSPPWEGRMVCPRGPLWDLANRVVALDRKSPAPAKLTFSASGIEFVAKSALGMVSGTMAPDHASLSGEVTLRFNSMFLADALANLISDQVEIRFAEDPLARPKPVLVADPNCEEVWNLVMPMRAG